LTAPPGSAASVVGLFGIRKKLERAEEAAAEAVRGVDWRRRRWRPRRSAGRQ
jgi:hypothetical protein